ncbi:hypothetical protein HDF23_000397 [Mucilaginibacter lappiensis]|uniref:Integrase catalytic domain-containing protein n=1 Tax=Mucilaginibacter lappiensis TaxID=354630 RepID=A0ABR6PD42_9SPHI|nr:Mu transposase C-terminal domain-containing protein [Mucilaginibacter lappiensis]MBB6107667.1 hypothetical protein [Mucilaginibacter lappiensis]
MKKKILSINGRVAGIMLYTDIYYLKIEDLTTYFSIPYSIIKDFICEKNKSNILNIGRSNWISLDEIPVSIKEYNSFPTKYEIEALRTILSGKDIDKQGFFKLIKEQLNIELKRSNQYNLMVLRCDLQTNENQIRSISRSYALFNFLKTCKLMNGVDKFLLYNQFKNEDLIYKTNSKVAFLRKYREFLKNDIKAFLHKNIQNHNAQKITPKDEKVIMKKYGDGVKYSMSEILKFVNTDRIIRGKTKISAAAVRRTILNHKSLVAAKLARYGHVALEKVIGHASRIQPMSIGEQYQLDGTRLNFLFCNENGDIGFLYAVVALDVYSKKIVAFSLNEKESFTQYISCLKTSIKKDNFIPYEILTDNFSGLSNDQFLDFENRLSFLGCTVRKHLPGQPMDKGHIENWFHIIGKKYLKRIPGYLGDGLLSGDKDGKPTQEMIQEARKRKNIRTRAEVYTMFENEIINFNSTYVYKNSTPNNLFNDSKAVHVISLDSDGFRYMLFNSTKRFINNQLIKIEINRKRYEYLIWDDQFLLNYLYKEVIVRYDPDNPQIVYIYNKDNFTLLLEVDVHLPYHLAKCNQTKRDELAIFQIANKRKELKSKLKAAKNDFIMNYEDIPLNGLIYTQDSKNVIHSAEEKLILSRTLTKNDKIKRRKVYPILTQYDPSVGEDSFQLLDRYANIKGRGGLL